MRWVKKTGEKLFRLNFSTDRSSRKSQVFRLDPPVGKLSGRKLDLGISRKRPFSTNKSDCIRNGLRKFHKSKLDIKWHCIMLPIMYNQITYQSLSEHFNVLITSH